MRIKSEHPFWGYRRVWSYLRFREHKILNVKRIYRIMCENELLVSRPALKALRTNSNRSKPRAVKPNEYWGIDMTKVMIPSFGWVYVEVLLDWYTKQIIGYDIDIQSKNTHWLQALEMGVGAKFPDGAHGQGVKLVSDNGSQPTSLSFMKACSTLGIKQIFASYNNPKGNADTERVIRTLKEDIVYPYEYETVEEFKEALERWIKKYNEDFPHSTLGQLTPVEFEQKYKANHNLFAA